LGEVCMLYQPKTISGEMLEEDGKYLVYGANGVIGRYSQYNHEESEVLLTCRGATCGSINISEPFSWINGNAMVVKPIDANNILPQYLKYYLLSVDWNEVITGAAQPQITRQSLSPLHIIIPPLPEQEKIVAELDCLSGIIEKKKQQLKELDSLAQSIFYEMFGNPIDNEKGWEVKRLEELCDIINGFAFPSSDFAECNPIKVIKITNVGVNEFISDDSSLPKEYNNMEGCKVHTGDIVIALTRTIILTGVKRAIVPNEYNESLVNQRVAAILANDRIVSRRFIYSFLGTDFVRQYILQKATALMQPNLSIRDLRDMPTVYPPLALQQEFASKIDVIEKQKELIKQSIAETETLFNSRMDFYFNLL